MLFFLYSMLSNLSYSYSNLDLRIPCSFCTVCVSSMCLFVVTCIGSTSSWITALILVSNLNQVSSFCFPERTENTSASKSLSSNGRFEFLTWAFNKLCDLW